jgi:hypothetical protein
MTDPGRLLGELQVRDCPRCKKRQYAYYPDEWWHSKDGTEDDFGDLLCADIAAEIDTGSRQFDIKASHESLCLSKERWALFRKRIPKPWQPE